MLVGMNFENVISAECMHEICDHCRYEDCACDCHFPDSDEFYDAGENDTIEQDGYA